MAWTKGKPGQGGRSHRGELRGDEIWVVPPTPRSPSAHGVQVSGLLCPTGVSRAHEQPHPAACVCSLGHRRVLASSLQLVDLAGSETVHENKSAKATSEGKSIVQTWVA